MHHFTTTSTAAGSVAAKPSTTCSPSYEMTLCRQISSEDPDETRWLINKRHGLPTSVSSISKHAKERGLEPFGGTAVQVHNNIQGSLFCFLPMSIPSCLPVHFNAHFLVDDSRKHLDKLPHLEDWNNVISDHILVPSCLELILEARSYVSVDNKESIEWYYNLFPDLNSLSNKSEASKLNMEKNFYVQLLKNDHPVLLDARAIAKGEVEWLTPKGSMFCVELHDVQIMNSKIQTILVSLGMPIVHAPTFIFGSFYRLEDSDYRGFVTPDNVLHHIAGLDEEDTDVSDIIKDNCELLIQFCIQIKTKAQIKEALKGVPLLLTKEGTLNRSGSLYSCKHSALLPHCSEKFIVELLENSKVVGKKLQDAGVIVDLPIHIVAQYIQLPDVTKPVGLSADQIHLLKLFWWYISSQGFLFLSCSCVTEYYNSKPIIPAADGLVYPPRLSKCVLNESDDSNKSVISVMKMLGYSTDNFSATINLKPSISSLLLHVSSASDVIKCLQLRPPTIDKSELKFTPEEASHFISLLSLCDEIPAPVAELLKSLPLFQTVDSTFITLSEGKRFYIKPMDPEVPSEGIISIQRETKELVLQPPGIQADQFYKKIISEKAYLSAQPGSAKFYIQYLIPNFIFLSDKESVIHLKYIRDHWMLYIWQQNEDWKNVIELLGTTPLIPIEGKRLKVSAFYNPQVKFHAVFNTKKLPPKQWCEKDWIDFFQYLGLKKQVDHQDWLKNAKKIAEKAAKLKNQKEPPDDLILESETLQFSLIELIKPVHSQIVLKKIENVDQTFKQFLNDASKPAFMYNPKPCRLLRTVELVTGKQPRPHEYFVRFHEATYHKNANATCLVRTILPETFDYLSDSTDYSIRDALHIRPLTVKSTVQNLIVMSRALSDATRVVVANKSIVTFVKFLKELYERQYAYLEKHKDDKSIRELMNEPCILLSSDNIVFNLVKPSQLVKRKVLKEHDFRPFCYETPIELLQYGNLLKVLGVQEVLKPIKYLEILCNIKKELEKAQRPLPEDDQYMKVCKSAYQALVIDLRTQPKDFCFSKETKIFLPSDSYQLIESSKLVHNDTPWIASRIKEKLTGHKFLLEPPPDERGQTLPPPCLKVQLLSKIAFDVLHDDVGKKYNRCVDQELFEMKKRSDNCMIVEVVQQTLTSHDFTKGLGRLYWHEHQKTPKKDREFSIQVKKLTELTVTCIREIKTIIVFKDEQIHGTEDTSRICHLVDRGKRNKETLHLYVKHLENQCYTEDKFFEELAETIKKHLNHILQNQALIKAILQCDPRSIQRVLDMKQVSPFDMSASTADKADKEEIGSDAALPFLEKEDMMLVCNFDVDETVIYHALEDDEDRGKKPVFKYAKVTSCRQAFSALINDKCVKIRLDATKEDTIKVSIFQVYKILNASQYEALKNKQGSSSFSSPLILANLPENEEELDEWLESTLLFNANYRICSFSALSRRMISHMHYLFVVEGGSVLKDLFLPAAKKVLKMVKKMDDGTSDPKLEQSIIELVRGLKDLLLKDDEVFGNEDVPAVDPSLMEMPDFAGLQSPQTQRYRYHPRSRYTVPSATSSTLAQPIFGSRFTTRPSHHSAAPRQPAQYITNPGGRFVTIQPEAPRPNTSLPDAKMWFQQCKADYQAALSMFGNTNVRELEEAIEQDEMQMELSLEIEASDITDSSGSGVEDMKNDSEFDEAEVKNEGSDPEDEVKPKPQHDPDQPAVLKCKFPALVCFLCHDVVEKCIKGIFYAKCGMPIQLVKVPHLMSLYENIKVSEHCPQELKKAIHHSVLQVNEHCNTSRYPNYQIPPCAPASVYTDLQAREAIIAAGVLLKEVIKFPDLQEIIGELEELPRALLQLGSISDEQGKLL